MKEEDYQDLLNRATSLMDERAASIPPTALPGPVSIKGRTLSYDPTGAARVVDESALKIYPGDLQVSDNEVRVVPFGVLDADLEHFMVPNIRGTSIFEPRPPTLGRRQRGAAVYIESEFELYPREEASTGVDDNPYLARLIACNIVDRALGQPYPIEKAIISLTVPSGTWGLEEPVAKAYRLLGVYNAQGRVFNQTFIGDGGSWEYKETTLPDGRIIPSGRHAATIAPIKYRIIFDY